MPRGFPLFVIAFFLLVALAWGVLAATQQDRDITTEITIDAPPEQVWRVLAATNDYPLWNPLVLQLSGHLQLGEKLRITVPAGESNQVTLTVRVTTLILNRELAWQGGIPVPGIFEGDHHMRLEAAGDGRTRFLHFEHYNGLLVGPFMRGLLDRTERGFHEMNSALKARVEKGL
ncbi:MAG: SRPBCC domain-containing protein [Acidobacteria bacterium]|nr:SRPBCC domain-containing protein [Acidobacteriota bacterium]